MYIHDQNANVRRTYQSNSRICNGSEIRGQFENLPQNDRTILAFFDLVLTSNEPKRPPNRGTDNHEIDQKLRVCLP